MDGFLPAYMSVCVHIWSVLNPLELELQIAAMWVLGTEPMSSVTAANAVNY